MPWQIATHDEPAWRDRANFILGIGLDHERREQLWARKLSDNRFEVCCIPFFAYDLALGDEVEIAADGEMLYMVRRVVKPSGHYTFRVWFGSSQDPMIRQETVAWVAEHGWLFERWSDNLLAIDAPDQPSAQQAANFLWTCQGEGRLVYETGLRQERSSSCLLDETPYEKQVAADFPEYWQAMLPWSGSNDA